MSLFSSSFETAGAGPSFTAGTPNKNGTKGNKRKRPSGNEEDLRKQAQVNLEKLMKKVEGGKSLARNEGSEPMGVLGKKTKKKMRESDTGSRHENSPGFARSPAASSSSVSAGKKAKKQLGSHAQNGDTPSKSPAVELGSNSKSKPQPAELPLPHSISSNELSESVDEEEGMTKLQKGMKAKLEGARFRWINEQLYSNPSTEAVAMMKKDPKIFADYHLTHRALTSAWPSPPLPHIITLLTPLPARTVIVDLGCGDAGLAKALVPQGKIVLSYDLVGDRGVPSGDLKGKGKDGGEGWVVEADFLEGVPLPGRPGGSTEEGASTDAVLSKSSKRRAKAAGSRGGSEIVDIVVCCLSLMGTNWVGGIYEACRVLKQSGTLHIAEVTSRFTSTQSFIETVQSFGFELITSSSPSTHFTLFEFKKTAVVPIGPVRGEAGWTGRVEAGEKVLRACVYKKR